MSVKTDKSHAHARDLAFVLNCIEHWVDIDEIGCGEYDVYMMARPTCATCPRAALCNKICDAVTNTTEEHYKAVEADEEVVPTLLGPCPTCGESMKPDGTDLAQCPKCGYQCKRAQPTEWCACGQQKTTPREHYIVWPGGGHGWVCSFCGLFTQTG